jgi:hypothetical protein
MKWLLIGFIIIQVGVDLAHSVTAFPFVHYGMFSERFSRPDSLNVFEVSVDGRRLEPSDFRVYRWDMITGPLGAVDHLKTSGDFAFDREKLREYLEKAGASSLYGFFEPSLQNDPGAITRFPDWYKSFLIKLLGRNIGKVRVDLASYRYQDGRLSLIRKTNYFTV